MQTVYRLKDDWQHIERVQHATLTTKDFGLQPTHGLFGSEDWWNRIETRELQLHTLKGVITKVYMGSMNDWPMFAIKDAAGHEEHFTREANSSEQGSFYKQECIAEIDYVWQTARRGFWNKGADRKIIVEIRVKERDD